MNVLLVRLQTSLDLHFSVPRHCLGSHGRGNHKPFLSELSLLSAKHRQTSPRRKLPSRTTTLETAWQKHSRRFWSTVFLRPFITSITCVKMTQVISNSGHDDMIVSSP